MGQALEEQALLVEQEARIGLAPRESEGYPLLVNQAAAEYQKAEAMNHGSRAYPALVLETSEANQAEEEKKTSFIGADGSDLSQGAPEGLFGDIPPSEEGSGQPSANQDENEDLPDAAADRKISI